MITFNNIVAKFQTFCDDHKFIQTFSYGSPADVDLDKFEQYPLLHLVYTGGDYNSERVKTYNLEVYILSVPPSEADKTTYQKESISDAEQVAEDILADIQNGGNIFSFGYHYDVTAASVTPLEEEKSNALAGCLLDISIAVPYSYDSCNAPLEGVDPEGSITPSYKARGLLRVRELDGDPDVVSVATINVPNGSLTDNGQGDITLTFGGDNATRLVQTVKNVSGGELTKGTPVHAVIDGASGNLAYVIAARADTPSAMPATFVLNETLADEAEGEAIITGLLQGVDTDAFQPGDVVYVGETGGYTNVKPTGTNLIQNLGIVLKKHPSNGSGIVYGSGRSNDVPNIPNGQTWIGNASGVATPTTLADVATAGTAISLTDIDSVGSGDIITDAERTKLTGIEAGAEVNPTASEIKTLYESNADTNAFTDAEQTKLLGIEAGAEVNPTASEIKTAYESNANTNAFTDAEQTKLAGIEAGAEVNVNADWNAISGDAEILNKPNIPSAQVNSDWNSTSGVSEILNKPTIPANPAVEDNAGTPQLATGITQAEMQSVLNVDPAGTDNSTDVSIGATATDVLKMAAGQNLGAFDAGADKLVFWDDSESKLTYATIGTNLTMTGRTLSAAGGAGGGVSSVNTLTGALTLAAGSNVTITDNGTDTITIAASGGGGGGAGGGNFMITGFTTTSTQQWYGLYLPYANSVRTSGNWQHYMRYHMPAAGNIDKVSVHVQGAAQIRFGVSINPARKVPNDVQTGGYDYTWNVPYTSSDYTEAHAPTGWSFSAGDEIGFAFYNANGGTPFYVTFNVCFSFI